MDHRNRKTRRTYLCQRLRRDRPYLSENPKSSIINLFLKGFLVSRLALAAIRRILGRIEPSPPYRALPPFFR
jgi:hypothetical protein